MNGLFTLLESPARLAGMAYPAADTNWRALHRLGFRHIVRLHSGDYDPAPLEVVDVALADLYGGIAPADATREEARVREAARLVADAVASGQGVVVHCLGGTGRTGTVLACALRLLGCSADEAVAALQAHRPRWPESPWQEEVARRGPEVP